MTTAMILCAGLGTRLRPLTEHQPKPLVWLGDRPILAHIAERLARGGVRRAVLNTHHLSDRFDSALLGSLPIEATAVHEVQIAGTAGGVAGAAAALGEGDVLVWNGDILVDVDVQALLLAHRAKQALSTLVVKPRAKVGEGTVGIGADGAIVRLRGEIFGVEVRSVDFLGLHVIGAALRPKLPAEGCLVGDVYLPMLRAGISGLSIFEISNDFRDIGTIGEYLAENLRWLETTGEGAWIGPGAQVDPAVDVSASVIGANATVLGSGVFRNVVVWPGAVATAPLSDAVVLPDGRVCRVTG